MTLSSRARAAVLAVSAAAALLAALVFTDGLWFREQAVETYASRWRAVGALLPGSHIEEAVLRLVGPAQPRRAGGYSDSE